MWYGGQVSESVNVNRLVSYVDQKDMHLALVRCGHFLRAIVVVWSSDCVCSTQLTVEETLHFALECLEVGALLAVGAWAPLSLVPSPPSAGRTGHEAAATGDGPRL